MEQDRLIKVIYKFLDDYVGNEIITIKKIDKVYNPHNFIPEERELYSIYSKNKKILILTFRVFNYGDKITLFRGVDLCDMVSRFFSLEPDFSSKHISTWFADRFGMNKVSDLLKFIPASV